MFSDLAERLHRSPFQREITAGLKDCMERYGLGNYKNEDREVYNEVIEKMKVPLYTCADARDAVGVKVEGHFSLRPVPGERIPDLGKFWKRIEKALKQRLERKYAAFQLSR